MDKSDSQPVPPISPELAPVAPEGEVLTPATDSTPPAEVAFDTPSAFAATDTAPTPADNEQPTEAATEPAPTPVKSAKDAINARYANRPSEEMPTSAKSAKDIINGAAVEDATSASRSATSIHHSGNQRRRMESVRPSASALLQPAKPRKSTPPVVRTSLKLAPKRTPAPRPQRLTNATDSASLRPRKQATRLSMDISSRRPTSPTQNTAAAVATIKAAAAAATPRQPSSVSVHVAPSDKSAPSQKSAKSLSAPSRPTSNGHVFQDVIRPAHKPASQPAPEEPASALSLKSRKSATKSKLRPLDSIKNRFRPAPKGYAATDSTKIRPARLPRAEDFLNPSQSLPKTDDEAVHFYGLTEAPEQLSYSDVPAWVKSESGEDVASSSKPANGLGVVEDYRPQPGDPIAVPVEEPVPVAKKASPDNNRYALGAQSPYFLKSVQVEKRPLSDSSPLPPRPEPSVYAAQSLEPESSPKKNTYEKKTTKKSSKKSKKSAEATVIVPARRRSHAPLFGLLLLTVILGAIVGAAAYLFFFQ